MCPCAASTDRRAFGVANGRRLPESNERIRAKTGLDTRSDTGRQPSRRVGFGGGGALFFLSLHFLRQEAVASACMPFWSPYITPPTVSEPRTAVGSLETEGICHELGVEILSEINDFRVPEFP